MDAPAITPGLTHAELRTSFKIADANYANTAFDKLSRSDAIYNARFREVYHMGIHLCDAHVCSAETIQRLVNDRLRAIDEEAAPFLPNALESDESTKNPDTKFMEWMADAQVERLVNLDEAVKDTQDAYQDELRRISTRTSCGPLAVDARAVRESIVQVPSTPSDQESEYPDTQSGNTPVIPSTPSEMRDDEELPDAQSGDMNLNHAVAPVFNYEHDWETDSDESGDIETQVVVHRGHLIEHTIMGPQMDVYEDGIVYRPRSVHQNQEMPFRPPVTIEPRPASALPRSAEEATGAFASPFTLPNPLQSAIPLGYTFRDAEKEFRDTLDGYAEQYGHEEASLDHFEIKEALEDGIKQARRPRIGLMPLELVDTIEERVMMSARRERDRRERSDERAANGEWRPKTHLELFGPDIPIGPSIEKRVKESNEGIRATIARRALLLRIEFDSKNVPRVILNDSEDAQMTEEPEVQRIIDDVQYQDRRHVSPVSSPTRQRRKYNLSLYSHKISLTRIARGWRRPLLSQERQEGLDQPQPSQQVRRSSLDETLAASPEKKSCTIPETPQASRPSQQASATPTVFSPIRLGREHIQDQPQNVQRFYRQTVHSTPQELHDVTDSQEVKDITRRYWAHVEGEVPEMPESRR
jgi:hypothetical protein